MNECKVFNCMNECVGAFTVCKEHMINENNKNIKARQCHNISCINVVHGNVGTYCGECTAPAPPIEQPFDWQKWLAEVVTQQDWDNVSYGRVHNVDPNTFIYLHYEFGSDEGHTFKFTNTMANPKLFEKSMTYNEWVHKCIELGKIPASVPPPFIPESKAVIKPTIEHTGLSVGYYDVIIPANSHTNPAHNQPHGVVVSCNDIIEALNMNYACANVFKAVWRICAARLGKTKKGNNPRYDAEKAVFFSNRMLVQEKNNDKP